MTRRGLRLFAVWAVVILTVGVVQLGLGNGLFWLVFAVFMICTTFLMRRAGRPGKRCR